MKQKTINQQNNLENNPQNQKLDDVWQISLDENLFSDLSYYLPIQKKFELAQKILESVWNWEDSPEVIKDRIQKIMASLSCVAIKYRTCLTLKVMEFVNNPNRVQK